MRDEKKKKAEEKAAKESVETLYDEVFDNVNYDEHYSHLHDDAFMSADASEKVIIMILQVLITSVSSSDHSYLQFNLT